MSPLKIIMQPGNNEDGKSDEECVSTCNICGHNHDTPNCQLLVDVQYIPDTPQLSKARQTLPCDLQITKMADGSLSVLAKREFPRGSTFGPFEAKRNWTMNPVTNFPIRIFGSSPTETYHLDYSNEETSNWMCFISPASCAKEQNLLCYQLNNDIFYTAMRRISSGEELRVWYAPFYALKMKMPLWNVDIETLGLSVTQDLQSNQNSDGKIDKVEILNKNVAQELAERLPAQQLGAKDDKVTWSCKICALVINSVPSYAKHLMEHYKSLLGTLCNICNRKFYNLSVLQKHKAEKHAEIAEDTIGGIPTAENTHAQMILLNINEHNDSQAENMKEIVEEKYKNEKPIADCVITEKQRSEVSLLDANSINVNDLLQNNANSNGNSNQAANLTGLLENSSLKSILLENQCLNINLNNINLTNMNLNSITDSILAEGVKFDELATDLLEIGENSESSLKIDNLDCDICGKKFEKPEYLYRHLRKHTGEFICPSCLAVFARKENLVTHVCPSVKQMDCFECPYCQKQFSVKKYLKRHLVKHVEKNHCKWCRKPFSSDQELELHKCSAEKHVCAQCGRRFVSSTHLNRHVKLHTSPKPIVKKIRKKSEDKRLICEKCGVVFKTAYILKQHLKSHGERMFECDICHSRFHRISVLKQHKQIHQNAQIPCNVCGKKLKSKKALDVHSLLHGNKKYQCDKCDKSFFQRCNYLKHYKQIHGEKKIYKCDQCSSQFTSQSGLSKHVEAHSKPADFECQVCRKRFQGQYQLKRHLQTSHSGIVYRCPWCKMTGRHRHSMRRHFEKQHKSLSDEWNKPGFVSQLEEKMEGSADLGILKNSDNSKTASTIVDNLEVVKIRGSADDESALKNNVVFGDSNKPVDSFGNSESSVNSAHKSIPEQIDLSSANVAKTFNLASEIPGSLPQTENQEILLQVTDVRQDGINGGINEGQLQIDDVSVPQLSISDADAQLAESVLGSAYIFGEDGGDIMFYVLDGSGGIAEY